MFCPMIDDVFMIIFFTDCKKHFGTSNYFNDLPMEVIFQWHMAFPFMAVCCPP